MMPLERRNEPQMLRSFWKQYPSYRVQPLLYKRYNELLEARAFNEWLENRRIRKEGEEYTDAVGRLTETVNRRLPQRRYAPAERSGIRRAARDIAGPQHPGVGGCGCSKESMEERRLVRLPSAPQLWPGAGLHPGGGAHHSGAAQAQCLGLHGLPLLPRRLPAVFRGAER